MNKIEIKTMASPKKKIKSLSSELKKSVAGFF
jgi:hypothetical protein